MNRRGLAWRHCAFVFDGPENPPPPLVETPPLENGYHCRPNTNSNTAGAEGRVPGVKVVLKAECQVVEVVVKAECQLVKEECQLVVG